MGSKEAREEQPEPCAFVCLCFLEGLRSMSWGGNKTASFAHSQLAQLAWAINSVDRSRPLREIEEHLLQLAHQVDNINTRRDRELRAKRKALIKKIEKIIAEIDESSSSSSSSSRSSSSSSSSSSSEDRRKRRRKGRKRSSRRNDKKSSKHRDRNKKESKRKREDDDSDDERDRKEKEPRRTDKDDARRDDGAKRRDDGPSARTKEPEIDSAP